MVYTYLGAEYEEFDPKIMKYVGLTTKIRAIFSSLCEEKKRESKFWGELQFPGHKTFFSSDLCRGLIS